MKVAMKNALIGMASTIAMFASNVAQSTVLDFNAQANNQYWINTTSSQGFTERTATGNGGNIGLVTRTDGFGNSNGTVSLISWTNGGFTSGFTLTSNDSSPFSVSSFDFANGYSSYDFVNSVDVIGYYLGGGSVVQSFSRSWGASDFVTLEFNSNFKNLSSVQFVANGANNRAVWDNIVVNAPVVSAVPEPETYVMLMAGLGLVGFTARRRKNSSL